MTPSDFYTKTAEILGAKRSLVKTLILCLFAEWEYNDIVNLLEKKKDLD